MGTKITELPPATFIADNAEFAISQDILLPGGRDTYKVTMSQLSSYITSTLPTPVAMPLYPGTGGGGSSSVDSVPIGTIFWFAASAAPTGYKECNGEVLSKVTYNDLWLVIGNTFSNPISANHFKIPDLRGEFVRGWSHGKAGVNTGRTFGSNEADAFQGHWHELYAQAGAANASVNSSSNGIPNTPLPADLVRNPVTDGTNGTPRTASETRPRNVALLPCIKFEYTIASSMVSLNFIKTPTITPRPGDSLVFDGATNTWVPSAVPTAPQQTNQPYTAKAFGSILYRSGTDTRGVNQTTHVSASALYNVSSITWKSRGLYTVTFATPMANTNYVAIAQNSPAHDPAFTDADGNLRFTNNPYQNGNENQLLVMNKTVNSFEILCWTDGDHLKENTNGFSFVVFAL
jgi:hypothetical protein